MGDNRRVSAYVKACPRAPQGYAAWEAAGLAWLAETELGGGARTVRVLAVEYDRLELERLSPKATGPTNAQAEEFGPSLARTHAAGAPAFGAPPPTWAERAAPTFGAPPPSRTDRADPGHGWLGPADEPLPLPTVPTGRWGEFYAEQRVRHTLRLGWDRGLWRDAGAQATFERVAARLESGEFDDDRPPARLHGDLWAGNVLWTATGGVLIDPAAHGGHAETDLAMLALFGAPHLSGILAAYAEVAPLTPGWRERVGLHQLHPVMLHAVLFGGGYAAQSLTLARRYA